MRPIVKRSIFTAVLALLTSVSIALAQAAKWPVVLQHGFISNSANMQNAATGLEQRLFVLSNRWNTTWSHRLTRQASDLVADEAYASLPDSTIIVGHSNGGLIARRSAHDRRYRALVTIGTLHTGAPLAESALGNDNDIIGIIGWTSLMMLEAAQLPENDYGGYTDNHEDKPYRDHFLWVNSWETWIAGGLGVLDVLVRTIAEFDGGHVLHDMMPSSGFINRLNMQDSLNVEADNVQYRLAITSTMDVGWRWLIYDALMPAAVADFFTGATDWIILEDADAYDYYHYYYDSEDENSYQKSANASDWLFAAAPLLGLDATWCSAIGAQDGSYMCTPSDGIVPTERQVYPDNRADTRSILHGPSHMEETSSSLFYNSARDWLHDRVSVPFTDPGCSSNCSSSGFYVWIDGADPTQPGNYTFTAGASGGSSGYSYHWYTSSDGTNYSDAGVTSQEFTPYLGEGNTWLRVVVTSGSETRTANRQVNVCYSSSSCPW